MRTMPLLAMATLVAACADTPSSPSTAADATDATDAALVHDTEAPEFLAREATGLQFGAFALHVPKNVNHVKGVLVALGGPNTQGFAIGGIPFGPPDPALEASLQTLGGMFRDLASRRGLAILGAAYFGPTALPDDPASDALVLNAIAQAADLSGHPELAEAPILMYGMSGGGPEAAGFTRRNPGRVSSLFLKVPADFAPFAGAAGQIPTYMVLAENDVLVDNAANAATFQASRAAGAPWAMALEPGATHLSLSAAQRDLTVAWMKAILPFLEGGERPAHAGWLGDAATGEITPWNRYEGDPAMASWFPTRPLAEAWSAFIGF